MTDVDVVVLCEGAPVIDVDVVALGAGSARGALRRGDRRGGQ
ncbi:MAG: hypothetical protein ACXV3S_04765 [Kineosporiaceae bacterium]